MLRKEAEWLLGKSTFLGFVRVMPGTCQAYAFKKAVSKAGLMLGIRSQMVTLYAYKCSAHGAMMVRHAPEWDVEGTLFLQLERRYLAACLS